MFDTTLATAKLSQDGRVGANDDHAFAHPDAAFLDLARGLELYIAEITWKPAFHHLADLPVELRYKIYKYYLEDDNRSLTTYQWPCLDWKQPYLALNQPQIRFSVPFFPALCLISKILFQEVVPFLLQSLTLDCPSSDAAMYFIEKAAHFQVQGLDIANNIHKLKICDTNGMALQKDSTTYGDKVRAIDVHMMVVNNRFVGLYLTSCPNLRQIAMDFYAPVERRFEYGPSTVAHISAMSIRPYLEGLNPKLILNLKQLHTIRINGFAGRQNVSEDDYCLPFAIFKDDTVENLHPLLAVARQLVDGFKAIGQKMQIDVSLRWGDGEHENTTMK